MADTVMRDLWAMIFDQQQSIQQTFTSSILRHGKHSFQRLSDLLTMPIDDEIIELILKQDGYITS